MSNVDLSKAKAGDTVVFRCGGRAVIKEIKPFQSMPLYDVSFDGYNDSAGYDNSGSRTWSGGYSLVDITEVIPAPVAFDWKDAKWGDGFKHKTRGSIVNFIGFTKDRKLAVCETKADCDVEACLIENLTRAPEHDVEGV